MEIYEELEQATKLHRRLGCPVIDISELSIEETAHRVLRVVEERRRGEGEARMSAKPPVPLRYWALWWAILVVADIVFYVLLTPIWIGLRVVAWLAEFRARRTRLERREDARLERLFAVGADAVAARIRLRRDDLAQLRPDVVRACSVVERDARGEALADEAPCRRAAAAPRRRSAGRRCRAGSRGRRACPRAAARTSPSHLPRTSRSSRRSSR